MPLEGKILISFRQEYLDEGQQVKRKHTGIDIEGSPGDYVIASANGVVSYCGFSPIGGRTVVVRHNEKIRTTYLNLSQVYVQPGVFVKQGQAIAAIGACDDPSNTSCHLHFGIIYDGKYLDPEDVLKIDYNSISKYIKLKYIKPNYYVQASK
jgi:murein DD-endopeptidase MepM/ murein hydrolase activator NlpD